MKTNEIASPLGHPPINSSPGEFLERVAAEIDAWLDAKVKEGLARGMRLVLTMNLQDGTTLFIRRLSAPSDRFLQLEGMGIEGEPFLLMTNHQSVQLLVRLVPRKPQDPPRNEIGFHAVLKDFAIPE